MTIIIQKFGGTSLRNIQGLEFLLSHVKRSKDEGNSLVVVVSSMGRKEDPYATDTLISLLEEYGTNMDPLKKDLIMSCGEIISSAIVAHFLEVNGIPAIPLTGFQSGILTDDNFNSAKILDINTKTIMEHLEDNKVVVVAGFQGITSKGEITTLGRGGSDITAVVLGGFLNAKRVDIFTDVKGVATIDPKIIPFAKYLENISYSNMYSLASTGTKVIHPKAILAGEKYNLPIHICGTFGYDKCTIISEYENIEDNQIIGISIDDDNSLEKETKKISIFFPKVNNFKIRKVLNDFLSQYENHIIDSTWQDDMVQVIIDSDKLVEFSEKLYTFFFE